MQVLVFVSEPVKVRSYVGKETSLSAASVVLQSQYLMLVAAQMVQLVHWEGLLSLNNEVSSVWARLAANLRVLEQKRQSEIR